MRRKEKEKTETETNSIFKILITPGLGQGQSCEPGVQSRFPPWVAGIQLLEPLLLLPKSALAASWNHEPYWELNPGAWLGHTGILTTRSNGYPGIYFWDQQVASSFLGLSGIHHVAFKASWALSNCRTVSNERKKKTDNNNSSKTPNLKLQR